MRAIPNTVDLSSPPRRAPKVRTPPLRTAFAFDTVECRRRRGAWRICRRNG